jgi:hypothetical protein
MTSLLWVRLYTYAYTWGPLVYAKPMQNNNRVFPVKSAENIEQLAELIDGINWNQWLDTEN